MKKNEFTREKSLVVSSYSTCGHRSKEDRRAELATGEHRAVRWDRSEEGISYSTDSVGVRSVHCTLNCIVLHCILLSSCTVQQCNSWQNRKLAVQEYSFCRISNHSQFKIYKKLKYGKYKAIFVQMYVFNDMGITYKKGCVLKHLAFVLFSWLKL